MYEVASRHASTHSFVLGKEQLLKSHFRTNHRESKPIEDSLLLIMLVLGCQNVAKDDSQNHNINYNKITPFIFKLLASAEGFFFAVFINSMYINCLFIKHQYHSKRHLKLQPRNVYLMSSFSRNLMCHFHQ